MSDKDFDITLSIDTISPAGGMALYSRSRGLLAELRIKGQRRHSATIIQNIDFLLKSAGVSLEDVDFFTVTRGPGSFTGLRVGISTVKGLCFYIEKPVSPVSSLEAIALSFPLMDALICPVLDARKGEVYAAGYMYDGADLREVIPEQAVSMEDFLKSLTDSDASGDRMILFPGASLTPYREIIISILGNRAVFPPGHMDYPLPSAVAMLGFVLADRGEFIDASDVAPVYLRKSEAEINEERLKDRHS